MKQRLATLFLLCIALLAAAIAEAQSHGNHSWYYISIGAIVDTGNHSVHRVDGTQRCSVGGETRFASTYESHDYDFIWYSYNQYSSTKHEYKRDDSCPICGHVKHTSQLLSHQCQSIYDTYCDLCGYSSGSMCG